MDIALIKTSVIDALRDNQSWAPFVVAALAFGESLAFLSFLVPATVILVGIGVLVGTAGLEFWPLWLGATLGATAGDVVSYEIGRRFKHSAYRVWPLSAHPDLITRGEMFFSRYGSWGVFLGRFFGPARAVVPLIAGIFLMRYALFMAANISSASVWAFVLLAPGAGLAEYLSW
jgi:membrane protein DedA with SNARE-associated domain